MPRPTSALQHRNIVFAALTWRRPLLFVPLAAPFSPFTSEAEMPLRFPTPPNSPWILGDRNSPRSTPVERDLGTFYVLPASFRFSLGPRLLWFLTGQVKGSVPTVFLGPLLLGRRLLLSRSPPQSLRVRPPPPRFFVMHDGLFIHGSDTSPFQ